MPRHHGAPRVYDPYAEAASEEPHAPRGERARARARYPRHGLVVAVAGEHAEDVVNAVHLESRTPTYVVPREEADLAGAVATARGLSDPAIVFFAGVPRTPADVRALYDARLILPPVAGHPEAGGGLVVRLGRRAGAGVEEMLQQMGLWAAYRTVPAETAADAATGLIHLVGLVE